jgi:hypothetical protein
VKQPWARKIVGELTGVIWQHNKKASTLKGKQGPRAARCNCPKVAHPLSACYLSYALADNLRHLPNGSLIVSCLSVITQLSTTSHLLNPTLPDTSETTMGSSGTLPPTRSSKDLRGNQNGSTRTALRGHETSDVGHHSPPTTTATFRAMQQAQSNGMGQGQLTPLWPRGHMTVLREPKACRASLTKNLTIWHQPPSGAPASPQGRSVAQPPPNRSVNVTLTIL